MLPGELQRRRLGLQVELDSHPREAQHAQGVVREGPGSGGAQPASLRVGEASQGIDRRASADRLGDRVDGEVAQREVGGQRFAAKRLHVELPRAVARDDPPRFELVRERKAGRAAGGARHRARRGARVALHHDVEVHAAAGPPQKTVAHGAADQPRPLARERCADRLQAGAHAGAAPAAGAPARLSRGASPSSAPSR